ncbi:MAG: tyrosine-type recombinase/integrase [Xenococcaceae cyanobacterium]
MRDASDSITRLEAALAAPISTSFSLEEVPDVVARLLGDKRSQNTKRAYLHDIKDFFRVIADDFPHQDLVLEFLHLEQTQAVGLVLSYKAGLIERGLKEATVNRRLAAIKALAAMGRQIGVCNYSLEDIKSEKVKAYRDTSGVDREIYAGVLSSVEASRQAGSRRSRLKGFRDYALLRLLWSNALRRGEIAETNINDFDYRGKSLAILGKGRGTEKEIITLAPKAANAIKEWLAVRGDSEGDMPLFIAVDNANFGHRLTGNGIYTHIHQPHR